MNRFDIKQDERSALHLFGGEGALLKLLTGFRAFKRTGGCGKPFSHGGRKLKLCIQQKITNIITGLPAHGGY